MILSPRTLSFFAPVIRIKSVKIVMYLINISLTILLVNRWLISGHFPLSNLYESLLFLSWSFSTIYSVTSFTLRGETREILLPTISWSVAPITLLTCGYAFFCVPQELQKAESLVPALQSNWLIMHVSVMILSYASLILGSLFAFSLLLIVHYGKHNFLEIIDSTKNKLRSRSEALPTDANLQCGATFSRSKISTPTSDARLGLRPKVSIQEAKQVVKPSFSTTLSPSSLSVTMRTAGEALTNQKFVGANHSSVKSKIQKQNNVCGTTEGNRTSSIESSAYCPNKVSFIKNNNFLDNLSYRFIGLGFALLTLGIISGAVWANSAWGSYWSWDPKETWAFITWLTYAVYLHLRISKGWYGKQSAYVAVFGFFVIWFCYLGVNLFGKGLHSYAFV